MPMSRRLCGAETGPPDQAVDEDEEGLPIDYACPETTRGEEGGVKKTGCGEMQQV